MAKGTTCMRRGRTGHGWVVCLGALAAWLALAAAGADTARAGSAVAIAAGRSHT